MTSEQKPQEKAHIVIIGDVGVGKSVVMSRIIKDLVETFKVEPFYSSEEIDTGDVLPEIADWQYSAIQHTQWQLTEIPHDFNEDGVEADRFVSPSWLIEKAPIGCIFTSGRGGRQIPYIKIGTTKHKDDLIVKPLFNHIDDHEIQYGFTYRYESIKNDNSFYVLNLRDMSKILNRVLDSIKTNLSFDA